MTRPLVELRAVSKQFGTVRALDGVDFSVQRCEIRGLLGENGAGKSTLMKVLYGLYAPDSGEVRVDGEPVHIASPRDSIDLGIGMVHQVSTLVPEFNAVENIMMGGEGDSFTLPVAAVERRIRELSDDFGLEFPLDAKVKGVSAGVKQKIEIVRALYRGARLLILDEPTTSLVESEFVQLLESLKRLVTRGVTVIFITHKMREVMEACDSVTVMRKGRVQSSLGRGEMTKERLVKLMFLERDIDITDSALPNVTVKPTKRSARPLLELDTVGAPGLHDLSFHVHGGEIVGVAAVSGNGERELAEIIVHPRNITSGEIRVDGASVNGLSTLDVFAWGVAFTPEDRVHEGVLNDGSIVENTLLGHHGEARFVSHRGFVRWNAVRQATRSVISEYNVDTPDETLAIRRLSGGNMQKSIIGRAFVSDPRVLVTHNPTSGLDISTVEFIFERLVRMRTEGGAVLWISEDLDELMILSDRIVVLHGGSIAGEFDRDRFDKVAIGLKMIGG